MLPVKKFLPTVMLMGAAVALLVFVAFFERRTPSTDELMREERMVLPDFKKEQDKITRIVIQRPRKAVKPTGNKKNGAGASPVQKIVLEKVGERRWKITEPVEYPADYYRCRGILVGLAGLRKVEISTGVFKTSAAPGQKLNPADFGLDPQSRIRIACFKPAKEGGGEVQVAEVFLSSERAAGGENAFAAVPSLVESEVYLVGIGLQSEALTPLDGLREARIFQKMGYDDIAKAVIRRPGELGMVEFDRLGFDWFVSRPVKDRGRADRIEEALRGVVSVMAESFEKDGVSEKDLAGFGLDEPRFRITLTGRDGRNMVLLVGNEVDAGGGEKPSARSAYAMLEGVPTVVTIGQDFVEGITRPVEDYRDDTLISLQPEKVERVVIRRSGEPAWDIRNAGGDWKFREPEPFDADDTVMADFIADMKNVKIADFLPQGFELDDSLKGAVSVVFYYAPDSGLEPEGALFAPASKDKIQARRLYMGPDPEKAPFDPANVFFVPKRPYELLSRPLSEFRNRDMFSFKRSDVSEVSIEFADGSVQKAVKEKGKWRLLQPPGIPNGPNIEDIVWRASALRAEKLLGELAPERLGDLGLDEPEVRLRITAGSKRLDLLLGKERKDGVPAKLAGGKTVFLLKGGDDGLLSFCLEGLAKERSVGKPAGRTPEGKPARPGAVSGESTGLGRTLPEDGGTSAPSRSDGASPGAK